MNDEAPRDAAWEAFTANVERLDQIDGRSGNLDSGCLALLFATQARTGLSEAGHAALGAYVDAMATLRPTMASAEAHVAASAAARQRIGDEEAWAEFETWWRGDADRDQLMRQLRSRLANGRPVFATIRRAVDRSESKGGHKRSRHRQRN